MKLPKLMFSSLMLFAIQGNAAVEINAEFSADAVMMTPQQPAMQSKMYVSKKAVRTETNMNGREVIEITYPEEYRSVLLYPQQKIYLESKAPQQQSKNKATDNSPCAQLPNAECQLLGKETIDGRQTEKWQVITDSRGQQLRTLHWIDTKRKLALREFFPDGSFSELKMVSKETVNGRQTEKWERVFSRPDGSSMTSYQWYDPELKIAIREEMPGGYVRELKNIKVGKQKSQLFVIPKNYNKMDQPVADQAPMR